MLLPWRGAHYLCATVLVLLAYFKTSSSQTTISMLITTEPAAEATTIADPTTTAATTTVTTVAPTTLEPTTPLPILNAPGNVIVADEPSDNTAFTVSWDDDQDNRLTVTYNIIVNTTDGSQSNTFSDVTPGYIVTGRKPGEEYGVVVVAVDDYSREEPSGEEKIRLQPNTVQNLKRQEASTTSVTAVWDEPLNSVFDSYDIGCDIGIPDQATVPAGGTRKASCTGVASGRLETITVTTVSGSRSNSADLPIWSKPNTVQGLEEDGVTNDSISVKWIQPVDHTALYYYTVNCSEGTADNEIITDGTTSATCSPVTAGSLVTVTVTTFSGEESNAASTMVRAKPNSVDALDEETATTGSVTASWLKPDGDVTQYNILCSPGNPQEPVVTDDGRITKYSATCVNIPTPGTECMVTVTSVSDTVAGESRSINITAFPIPPELMERPSTETSISVEWEKRGSVVDFYIIDCPNGTASPSSNITAIDGGTLTASCTELSLPGGLYNISVQSQSNDKLSINAATESLYAVPANVTLVKNPSLVDTVSATWDRPTGVFQEFTIQCTPTNSAIPLPDVIPFNPDESSYEADCNVSIPGDLYNMTVVSRSGNQYSSPSTIQLRALPESLAQLTVVNFSTDAVKLKWCLSVRCQDGGYNLTDITVIVQTDEINGSYEGNDTYEDKITLEEKDTDGNFIILEDLIPGECYNFTCIVEGYGIESSPKSIRQCTLPEAVKSFTVENITTNMVELQWEMKDRCQENGCVWSSFDVSHNPDFFEKNVPQGEMSTSFTSLTPGKSYTFTIIVLSEEEESSPVAVVDRTIPESVGEFNIAQYSTDFVELYWTIKEMCKDDKCVWDSYNLTYTSDGDPEDQQPGPPLDSTSLSTNVTNLTPGGNYNFFIIAVSGEKGSSPTRFVQRTKPETVEDFNVTSYSTEMVKLSWTIKTMCENGGCVWDTYNVSYVASSDTGGTPLEESRNSSSTEIEINDLTPGESYNFSITVLSGEEESDFKTVVQRTLPESVKTFEVARYTDTMASLNWTVKDECIPDGGCVWSSFEVSYNSSDAQNIPRDNRTTDVESLTPGEYYVFSISVKSEEEVSSAETVFQRLRPSDVENLAVTSTEQTVATIEWDRPDGVVTSYDITIKSEEEGRGGGETGRFDGDLDEEKHTATFENLIPGLGYRITVCTRSFDEICIKPAPISIETLPDKPSAPQDLSLEAEDIHTVIVTFSEPAFPNGDITEYVIRYSGVKDGSDKQEGKETPYTPVGVSPYSVTINDLVAGYTYTFNVTAVNTAGEGDIAESEITLEQLEPVDSTVPPEVVGVPVGTEIKSFTVTFSSEWFSHCNGELKNYSVFVVENGGNDTIGASPRSYKEAQSYKPLPVYLAIASETYPFPPDYSSCASQRKKRQTTDSVDVVIGDGTCSEDGKYCNGALHGNREYRVRYRACNDVGCSFSPYSEVIKTVLNPASWVVPLVFIIVILLCALIVAGVWRERKQPGSVTGYFKREKKGIDNRAFESDKPMRRQGDNRPVKLAEFGQFLEDMSRDSDYLFSEEYNDLRPLGKNQSTDAAQLEVNRVKNRFSNILPYDHTRVSLSPIDDEEGSDYINANYMLGYRSQREYIACQGPLQSTEEDMWRLVWEQGASIIVMVTQLMENGKIKCHQYWPDEGEGPVRYGDIVVNPGQVEKAELWTIRKFQITKGPVTRPVIHFNFIAWPDHGVPERPDDLIKFVEEVRASKKNDGKPLVVHCSAGVGRTGTFISLDHLMSAVKENDEVDIYGMVRKMRMNRCMMVQTESQYIFIHQCVMALLEGSGESDAVYENVNGNGYFNEALI